MDFVEADDNYNAHLGVTSTYPSQDDYHQDRLGYEYRYSGVVDNNQLARQNEDEEDEAYGNANITLLSNEYADHCIDDQDPADWYHFSDTSKDHSNIDQDDPGSPTISDQ